MTLSISREDLYAMITTATNHTIVEALPKKYYDSEHLPGAISIPHDEVANLAAKLLPDKNQTIVVYCANSECKNSHIAAQTLRQMGYKHVLEYTEGKKDWKEAELPIDRIAVSAV